MRWYQERGTFASTYSLRQWGPRFMSQYTTVTVDAPEVKPEAACMHARQQCCWSILTLWTHCVTVSDIIETQIVLAGHDIAGSNVDCPQIRQHDLQAQYWAHKIAKTMENLLCACMCMVRNKSLRERQLSSQSCLSTTKPVGSSNVHTQCAQLNSCSFQSMVPASGRY